MQEELILYVVFSLFGVAVVLFGIASYQIHDRQPFWASRLAFLGFLPLLIAWFLSFLWLYHELDGNYQIAESTAFFILLGCFFLIGIIPSLIGLVGLCAHFRSSCKRLAELEQIATILRQEINR